MTRGRVPVTCLLLLGGGIVGLDGCRARGSRPGAAPGSGHGAETVAASAVAPPIPASTIAATPDDDAAPRTLQRCFPEQPAWMEPPVAALLDHAGELFDAQKFDGALACAEEAARQAPRSVEAHHDRAAALVHLGRMNEARDAIVLALALDPDDPETLEASADLYINQLAPSADRSAIGLEYARRGFRRSVGRDRTRAARLALLEGQALIDLGRAGEALRRLDAALALAPKLETAVYERGVALFEVCRFAEAKRSFETVLAASPDNVHAVYHLGLVEERIGVPGAAEARLGDAWTRDPVSFPRPPAVSAEEFAARVRARAAALPEDIREDLSRAAVRIETAELPALEDLVAESPPLSPTILGLYRGLPIDWTDGIEGGGGGDRRPQAGRLAKGRRGSAPGGGSSRGSDAVAAAAGGTGEGASAAGAPERTIVLYRKNLLRSVRSAGELDQAIARTLLHEIGHLRGEDDGSLRDRGLE